MKQGGELINQLSKNLRTEAGPKDSSSTTRKTEQSGQGKQRNADHIDAINALFTMLEAAYPLKFKRAFPSDEALFEAKKIWTRNLLDYNPRRILLAGKKALDTSKFFPDLSEIRELCKLRYDEMGLKEPLQAYYEACHAPDQTRNHRWSHIAVYLAARETGWLTLRSEEQRVAYPIFERNYEIICNRVLDGEDLEESIRKGIEDSSTREAVQLAEEQAQQSLRQQMENQGIDPDSGLKARERLLNTLKN